VTAAGTARQAGWTIVRLLVAGFFLAWLVAVIYGALPPRKLVKWRAVEGAATAAAAAHKPIFYDFSASWCEPCKQMDREVFANAEVAGFINSNFVPVRVTDEDKAPAADGLRSEYRVQVLPTLLVVQRPGGDLRRIEGFHDKRLTLAFLKTALLPDLSATAAEKE
jgi:thiol:disulfide interchange protein